MTRQADRLLDLVDQHATELIEAERTATGQVADTPRTQIQALIAWLARTWLVRFGSITAPMPQGSASKLLDELAARMGRLRLDPGDRPLHAANRALVQGLGHGYSEVGGVPGGRSRIRRGRLEPQIRQEIDRIGGRVQQQADRSRASLAGLRYRDRLTYQQVLAVPAAAEKLVARNEATTSWAVNRANNQGIDQVARQLEVSSVWIAERDGCVVCLAYAGTTSPAGSPFPPDLTFGDRRPSRPWPGGILWYPPRHPHCRCSTRPVAGFDPATEQAFADALKREARRSIVRGFSLPTESEGVRLRAADLLLRRGAALPETVQEYGRRAVKRGRFPNRSVPTGRG